MDSYTHILGERAKILDIFDKNRKLFSAVNPDSSLLVYIETIKPSVGIYSNKEIF